MFGALCQAGARGETAVSDLEGLEAARWEEDRKKENHTIKVKSRQSCVRAMMFIASVR